MSPRKIQRENKILSNSHCRSGACKLHVINSSLGDAPPIINKALPSLCKPCACLLMQWLLLCCNRSPRWLRAASREICALIPP